MKRGSITSRRCKRCGQIATSPLSTYPQLVTSNSSTQIPLCANCAVWNNTNPDKVIQ